MRASPRSTAATDEFRLKQRHAHYRHHANLQQQTIAFKLAHDDLDVGLSCGTREGGDGQHVCDLGAQPSPAQPSPAQPSPAQPSPAQPSPAQPSPAQPSPAQPSPAQPSPAQPSPAQPSPAQPSPAQPSPAQPSPAQPSPYLGFVAAGEASCVGMKKSEGSGGLVTGVLVLLLKVVHFGSKDLLNGLMQFSLGH
ncbi:hypothetical protein V8C86DRAFT_3138019 [Haematococcus lacustris]